MNKKTLNNKGVTLIELLVVIVVLGIISAIAVPAVGQIVENSQKDAVLGDAVAVQEAARLYCAQSSCTTTQVLSSTELSTYIDGFTVSSTGRYTSITATLSTGTWLIQLNAESTNSSAYEFGVTDDLETAVDGLDPSAVSRALVDSDLADATFAN
ncbi:MAG: prepilin-type N-terminal cleavage/methylation domain-containing protein [Candidatus Izimaplasma sp.]|nr:prepilin-type N-terminal cleavage/methylation domain-containing protein [Candidatus Izimaplasma bacterium]